MICLSEEKFFNEYMSNKAYINCVLDEDNPIISYYKIHYNNPITTLDYSLVDQFIKESPKTSSPIYKEFLNLKVLSITHYLNFIKVVFFVSNPIYKDTELNKTLKDLIKSRFNKYKFDIELLLKDKSDEELINIIDIVYL